MLDALMIAAIVMFVAGAGMFFIGAALDCSSAVLAAGAIMALLAVAVGFSCAIIGSEAAADKFMRQCMQDHKEYERTAMRRAGGSHVVPMLIAIPIR